MKLKNEKDSISYPELKEKLETKFPDYKFNMRGKHILIGSKSNTAGANIIIRKGKMHIAGNFPTMGGTMIFAVTLVLLGVLIPIIVYFAAFHSKMKAFENEVGGYLKEEYEL